MSITRDLSTAFYMDRTHAHWDRAWLGMSGHYSNDGLLERGLDPFSATDTLSGETWQYMGSYQTPASTVHECRHRRHPNTGARGNVQVNISHVVTVSR